MRKTRCVMVALVLCLFGPAWSATSARSWPVQSPSTSDGQRDFDLQIGTWNTKLSRLVEPLSGSSEWVEYEGTTVVRKAWDGRASLVEFDVKGPAGRIEALSVRLYNPQSRQWSIHYASRAGGTLAAPVYGRFTNGRGEFHGQELIDGRAVFVRFVISPGGKNAWRFEQAFSNDGGKTWEVNWIAVDTRQ